MSVLCLSPHTDDCELGAGATIARMVDRGETVHVVAFSACEASVPNGWPDDVLVGEFQAASRVLGVASSRVLKFPVRRFPEFRQDILDSMIALRDEFDPDLVLCPARADTHQDHAVVAAEAVRAFKGITTLGYVLPWNCPSVDVSHWVRVTEGGVETKLVALRCYASQRGKPYAHEDAIRAALLTAGTQCGSRYAEPFETIRRVE